MARKMTAMKVEWLEDRQWVGGEKITCKVIGKMDSGETVWEDVDTGEQYFCFRLLGTHYFYKE